LVGMLEVMTVNEHHLQLGAAKHPCGKIDARTVFELTVNGVVYIKQREVGFRVDLDASGQQGPVSPVTKRRAGITDAAGDCLVIFPVERRLRSPKSSPHALGGRQI